MADHETLKPRGTTTDRPRPPARPVRAGRAQLRTRWRAAAGRAHRDRLPPVHRGARQGAERLPRADRGPRLRGQRRHHARRQPGRDRHRVAHDRPQPCPAAARPGDPGRGRGGGRDSHRERARTAEPGSRADQRAGTPARRTTRDPAQVGARPGSCGRSATRRPATASTRPTTSATPNSPTCCAGAGTGSTTSPTCCVGYATPAAPNRSPRHSASGADGSPSAAGPCSPGPPDSPSTSMPTPAINRHGP